jgi:hypothetical protein
VSRLIRFARRRSRLGPPRRPLQVWQVSFAATGQTSKLWIKLSAEATNDTADQITIVKRSEVELWRVGYRLEPGQHFGKWAIGIE